MLRALEGRSGGNSHRELINVKVRFFFNGLRKPNHMCWGHCLLSPAASTGGSLCLRGPTRWSGKQQDDTPWLWSSSHLREPKALHSSLILKYVCGRGRKKHRRGEKQHPYKNQWLYVLAKKNHVFWKMNYVPDMAIKSSSILRAHAWGHQRHMSPIKIFKLVFFLQRIAKSNYIHMSGICRGCVMRFLHELLCVWIGRDQYQVWVV